MTGSERATALFAEGRNCAQAVLCSFCDELGLSPEQALALTAPFGGGIVRSGETCGALIGLLMVCGAVSGGEDKANKAAVYEKAAALMEAFKAEAGSTFCRELLGPDKVTGAAPAMAVTCPKLVALAAELAEQMLEEM